jgi:hypothetical protein
VSDLALTGGGDLEITGGRLRVATGTEALSQRIRTRLRLVRGDWFLDLTQGVPYHDFVLRKRSSPAVQREVVRRALVTLRGVREVVSLDVDLDRRTRTLRVTGEVRGEDLSTVTFQDNPPLLGFSVPPAEGAAT